MNQKGRIKKILGAALIGMGVLLLVENSGLVDFPLEIILTRFWPLGLVFTGGLMFLKKRQGLGVVLIGLGSVFQVSKLTQWSFWSLLLPLVFILAGVMLLRKEWRGCCASLFRKEKKSGE